jgi:hypothetical protein
VKIQPELLVILLHVFLALVYAIFIVLERSHIRKEYIILICFVPVFGLLAALLVEFMLILGKQGIRNPDLEQVGLDDDILWATLKRFHEKGDLVPLEEAVLIDEVKVRRKSILETLYGDPIKYLDVLNVAKYNDDIETSHYATTTISKAQKDFQLSVQKYALEIERHPDDPRILDAYVEILRQYIQSGLLEERLLVNLRHVYSRMLDRKLAVAKDDKNALIEKLRNAVELKDYACAWDTSSLLKKYWSIDEQTWIEALRVCVEGQDWIQLQRTIEEIRGKEIDWTPQGREQVSPWLKIVTE